ncbi:ATPase domain-containing protein [Peredibacter starrii]|uniref:non-specific serine/threonine protein kinase n=1 Tax=Peredibacter starrii TaxID=28202 RepID=A0AAX4HSW8_9BACT|nr:ATPase domain-containing protein [Peredibacter starrii]WPU66501.1 ATPase domain-containing protein [Peredibacter starrii]
MPNELKKKIIKTKVHGLDEILGGGLIRGSIYLIDGPPGSGKTILGNQIIFNLATPKDPAAFITLLAEMHGKMLDHIGEMNYFNKSKVGIDISYYGAYHILEAGKLAALRKFLVDLIHAQNLKFIVIDGFKIVDYFSSVETESARFVHELSALASTTGCTLLLLNQGTKSLSPTSLEALVDGIIELKLIDTGLRTIREIQIYKMRGLDQNKGHHVFNISADGIKIFTRTESRKMGRSIFKNSHSNLKFGIKCLDEMLIGGIKAGSTTSLIGPPGSGKTFFGLKFLEEGLKLGETCVFFGFYEEPSQLVTKAASIGIDLTPYLENQRLIVFWCPPTENLIDEISETLMNLITKHSASRVFVDGIDGIKMSSVYPERFSKYVAALSILLRYSGATSLLTEETSFNNDLSLKQGEHSALIENIISLRYVNVFSKLHRLIAILKVRESPYDTSSREFSISSQGIDVNQNSFFADEVVEHKNPRTL